jgi:hypothetical protein
LLQIARHNHALLGATDIQYHHATAEDFLSTTGNAYDFIYADPSRRTARGKKTNSLQDSEPDITMLKTRIFQVTDVLILKTSPLLDIQAGITQLVHVKQVYIISVNNECKEILFICDKNFGSEPVVEAVNLTGEKPQTFEFTYTDERTKVVAYDDPLQYLYEPNASILKGGAFKSIANAFGLKKIHPSTHLYTSDNLIPEFPGRKFLLEDVITGSSTKIKKYFPDGKANVTTRNYPLSADALKKKTGLKDGGDKFLIGFSGQRKKFLVVAHRV